MAAEAKIWIALLRAVNVGGTKKLPMADFRKLLGGVGYQDAATYIQSGNAVFRAAGTAVKISETIGALILKNFGFTAEVIVLTLQEFQAALTANPFAQAADDPKTLHLFFLSQPAVAVDQDGLQSLVVGREQFQQTDKVFYLYTPDGFGRSKFAAKMNRYFDGPITGRNLRSCRKIIELAQSL
ncbi:MAG: DUF1697 domain-containing protein [Paracoccaceae bacterium]